MWLFQLKPAVNFHILLIISDSYRVFVSPYLYTHFQAEMEAPDRYETFGWREGQFLGDFDLMPLPLINELLLPLA